MIQAHPDYVAEIRRKQKRADCKSVVNTQKESYTRDKRKKVVIGCKSINQIVRGYFIAFVA
jgi:hypothetical protein